MEQNPAGEEPAIVKFSSSNEGTFDHPCARRFSGGRDPKPDSVRKFAAALLEHFDNDLELLVEIAQLFIDDCPRRLTALSAAMSAGDTRAMEGVAHSLKGSVASFGADLAQLSAQRVEALARTGDLPGATAAATVLALETEDLIADLKEVVGHANELQSEARLRSQVA